MRRALWLCRRYNKAVTALANRLPKALGKLVDGVCVCRGAILEAMIREGIAEKLPVLSNDPPVCDSICLIGHSQFAQWDVSALCGLSVRNCGINGISMPKYRELLCETGILDCASRVFVIIGGTNDIISSPNEAPFLVVRELESLARYISARRHGVRDRRDRDASRIAALNAYVAAHLPPGVSWISPAALNDAAGEIKSAYTTDGLHLSGEGYARLRECVEEAVRKAL